MIITSIGLLITAILTGALSALLMSGVIGKHRPKLATSIDVQNWQSNWAIGTQATTPYMRAYIARRGLLALPKSEAVYFIRAADDEGRALNEACTYMISGDPQMAKWWSITLYDAQDFLPLNQDNAYSIDQTSVGNGNWEIAVQATHPENHPHWLSSRAAGEFDLMMRLYKPKPALLVDPHKKFKPPSVQRLHCLEKNKGAGS
ncbi:MAG: DUF1214 domain-containing protein [Robiginitomaculum sp.]|nr:DUF1214 domain-containing protein [Robiginitomaculum sp.]